jgi:hypothetical protein
MGGLIGKLSPLDPMPVELFLLLYETPSVRGGD